MNYEGPITIRATSTGTDSTLAGIGRLVADAQAREAPVQRLADAVAGKFCYSVMAASAATFAFWSLAGASHFFWLMHPPPSVGLLNQHLCCTLCCTTVWLLSLINGGSKASVEPLGLTLHQLNPHLKLLSYVQLPRLASHSIATDTESKQAMYKQPSKPERQNKHKKESRKERSMLRGCAVKTSQACLCQSSSH